MFGYVKGISSILFRSFGHGQSITQLGAANERLPAECRPRSDIVSHTVHWSVASRAHLLLRHGVVVPNCP